MNTAHFKRCECGGQYYCTDSRTSHAGSTVPHIRRRYRCDKCGHRMTTAELVMPKREGRNKPLLDTFLEGYENGLVRHLKDRLRELL